MELAALSVELSAQSIQREAAVRSGEDMASAVDMIGLMALQLHKSPEPAASTRTEHSDPAAAAVGSESSAPAESRHTAAAAESELDLLSEEASAWATEQADELATARQGARCAGMALSALERQLELAQEEIARAKQQAQCADMAYSALEQQLTLAQDQVMSALQDKKQMQKQHRGFHKGVVLCVRLITDTVSAMKLEHSAADEGVSEECGRCYDVMPYCDAMM